MQGKNKKNIATVTTLGQRIHNLRKNKGLSQVQLAKKIGYKQNSPLSAIENDKSIPDIHVITRISEVFGVDLYWLVTGNISPITQDFLTKVKPYVMAYMTDVASEIENIHRQIVRLELGQTLGGEDHAKEISALRKDREQKTEMYEKTMKDFNAKFALINDPPKSDPEKE